MLPYYYRYNHTNYARWGTVYQLPEEVDNEFQKGNFVVKDTNKQFNQVPSDHSQEWLNNVGKAGGGIVGITKNTTALSRWALSYNLRSSISSQTKEMFLLGHSDDYLPTESNLARQ